MTTLTNNAARPDALPLAPAPPTRWEPRDWIALSAVVLLALAARGLYFSQVKDALWFVHPIVDAHNYDLWARSILQGDILGRGPFIHSPLYAFFLAGLYGLTAGHSVPAAGIQLLLGAVSCGLLYLIGRKVFSRAAGLAGGLAAAVYGIAFFHEGTLLTVVLIHLLNLLTLWSAYWAAEKKHPAVWAVPGVLLGLSALTRPNVLLWAVVLAAWIPWSRPRPRDGGGWRAWAPSVAVLAGSMMLIVSTATLRNWLVLHEFIPTVSHGGVNFFLGNSRHSSVAYTPIGSLGLGANDFIEQSKQAAEAQTGHPLTYAQSSRFWLRRAWEDIQAAPVRWERLLADKLLFFFNHYEYTTSLNYYAIREITPVLQWPWLAFGVVAPPALLGMFLARRRWRELLPLYGLVLAYGVSNVLLFVTSEYRYAVMPAFFLFAGVAAETAAARIRERRWRSLILPGLLLAALAVLVNIEILGREGRDYHRATAHSNFGDLLARLGEYPRAAEEYGIAKEIVRSRPENVSYLSYQQGRCYLESGSYAEALPVLQEAYGISSDDEDILDALATALTANRRPEEALVLRSRALELSPLDPVLHVNFGITCLWAGKDAEAEKAFARAVEIDPRFASKVESQRREVLASRSRRRPGGSD